MSADATIGIMDDEMYEFCVCENANLWALNAILASTCDLLLSPSEGNNRDS